MGFFDNIEGGLWEYRQTIKENKLAQLDIKNYMNQ